MYTILTFFDHLSTSSGPRSHWTSPYCYLIQFYFFAEIHIFFTGGSGISEPITAQGIVTREGFGTKNASHQFKQKIRQIVEEYAASSNPYDLVFTSGFENEQRKEIHL